MTASTKTTTTQVDEDGDGKIDKVITKGASGSANDVAGATVGDGADTDGLFKSGAMSSSEVRFWLKW